MTQRKKGIELNQAFGAVLTLVLTATLIIIAIVIFVQLATSFAETVDASITNETVTQAEFVAGSDSVNLDSTDNCSAADFVIVTVINESGITIGSGNYTLTSAGVLTNLTSTELVTWLVSYTYTWGSDACTASEDMTSEFGNYTSLIGLVGTVIFLGLVIGVLVASFAFGGRKET